MTPITQPADMRTQMDELATLARELLPSMHDAHSGLYAQKLEWTNDGGRRLGSNRLYSGMTAIGLGRDNAVRNDRAPVEGLDALHARAIAEPSTTGELATTVWALAESADERLEEVLRLLESQLRPVAATSMELGLVLSALAATIDTTASTSLVARPATVAAKELISRFSRSARLFRGSAWAPRPKRNLQWRMTSFASQVYPLLGLAELSRSTATDPPAEILDAADRLVDRQGSQGQWWWTYSMKSGVVLEGYPVYSVHQHAMALMALAPLDNLGVRRYRSELALGVEWLFGSNELETSLVDFERRRIARCIQRSGADADGPLGMSGSQWRSVVLRSWGLRRRRGETAGDDFEVLWECRPYELGWLLYARSLIAGW